MRLVPRLQGQWQLDFQGQPDRSYWVETSQNLRTWVRMGLGRERSPGLFTIIDPVRLPRDSTVL